MTKTNNSGIRERSLERGGKHLTEEIIIIGPPSRPTFSRCPCHLASCSLGKSGTSISLMLNTPLSKIMDGNDRMELLQ